MHHAERLLPLLATKHEMKRRAAEAVIFPVKQALGS
jgi:hypothetical protein